MKEYSFWEFLRDSKTVAIATAVTIASGIWIVVSALPLWISLLIAFLAIVILITFLYKAKKRLHYLERLSSVIKITSSPDIQEIPIVSGKAWVNDPYNYNVALFIHIHGSNWYNKPYDSQTVTPLMADCRWEMALNAWTDFLADRVGVYLIRKGVEPPNLGMHGSPIIPSFPDDSDLDHAEQAVNGVTTEIDAQNLARRHGIRV